MMVSQPVRVSTPGVARATACVGFLAVALGAFGAHALKDVLAQRSMTAVWDKAVLYHMVHAVVMLLITTWRPFPATAWKFFGAGILCFSGSLYAWALTGTYWLVFVTPLGGLCLLAGWLTLFIRGDGTSANTASDKII